MKLLKSFIIALSLAFSLGAFSTSVIAAGPLSTDSALKGIEMVIGHTTEAIKALDAGESQEVVRKHIKAALRESKEITGTELLEKKRLKVSRSLKKARTALKKGDTEKAKDFLDKTAKDFEKLKTYI